MRSLLCIALCVVVLVIAVPGTAGANCYTEEMEDAWVKLPVYEERLSYSTKEVSSYSIPGVEVALKLKVKPEEFAKWLEECPFRFKTKDDVKQYYWDRGSFMGLMTYDETEEVLTIEALRYDFPLGGPKPPSPAKP